MADFFCRILLQRRDSVTYLHAGVNNMQVQIFLCSGSHVQSSFSPKLRFLTRVSVVPCVLARAGVSMSSLPVAGTQAVTNLFFAVASKIVDTR